MGEVKLEKKKQGKLKGISKATYIIARIGKVCAAIGIPFVVLALVFSTIIMTNLDVVDDQIVLSVSDGKISMSEEVIDGENVLKVKLDNTVLAEEKGTESISALRDFLASKPKWELITCMDIIMILIIVDLVIIRITLKHLEKLFKNIHDEETPFSMENVNHFRTMGFLTIATFVISCLISGVAGILSKNMYINGFSAVSVFEILFLFVMSYIFEYGYEIQSESQATIYSEINEEK